MSCFAHLVKEDECDSDAENEQNHDPNVEEFLKQEDTAVIYPEAPEEDQRQGTPEASGQDENGKYVISSVLMKSVVLTPWPKTSAVLKKTAVYIHATIEEKNLSYIIIRG